MEFSFRFRLVVLLVLGVLGSAWAQLEPQPGVAHHPDAINKTAAAQRLKRARANQALWQGLERLHADLMRQKPGSTQPLYTQAGNPRVPLRAWGAYAWTSWFTDKDAYAQIWQKYPNTERTWLIPPGRTLPDSVLLNPLEYAGESPQVACERAIRYLSDNIDPLLEWVGESPFREPCERLVRDILAESSVPSPEGYLPTDKAALNGRLLHILFRLHGMSGKEEWLNAARRIADAYIRHQLVFTGYQARDGYNFTEKSGGTPSPEAEWLYSGLAQHFIVEYQFGFVRRDEYKPVLENLFLAWKAQTASERLHQLLLSQSLYQIAEKAEYLEAFQAQRKQVFRWQAQTAEQEEDRLRAALSLLSRYPADFGPKAADSLARWSRRLAARKPASPVLGQVALWYSQGFSAPGYNPRVAIGAVQQANTVSLTLLADSTADYLITGDPHRTRQWFNLRLPYLRPREVANAYPLKDYYNFLVEIPERKQKRYISGENFAQGLTIRLRKGVPLTVYITWYETD